MLRYTTDRARPGLVALYDVGQEMKRVYSYNSGARTGRVLRGVFIANHLESTDSLTSNNQETELMQMKTNGNTKSGHNQQQNTY